MYQMLQTHQHRTVITTVATWRARRAARQYHSSTGSSTCHHATVYLVQAVFKSYLQGHGQHKGRGRDALYHQLKRKTSLHVGIAAVTGDSEPGGRNDGQRPLLYILGAFIVVEGKQIP